MSNLIQFPAKEKQNEQTIQAELDAEWTRLIEKYGAVAAVESFVRVSGNLTMPEKEVE